MLKRFSYTLIAILLSVSAFAQNNLFNATDITVQKGAVVFVEGGLQIATGGTINNSGDIRLGNQVGAPHLLNHWNNTSANLNAYVLPAMDATGERIVRFVGSTQQQTIMGNIRTNFYNLEINNTTAVVANKYVNTTTAIGINGNLNFVAGMLHLGQVGFLAPRIGDAVLTNTGATVTNEANGMFAAGRLETTRTVNAAVAETFGGLGVSLNAPNTLGVTTLNRVTGPTNILSIPDATGKKSRDVQPTFESIQRRWRIQPATQPNGPYSLNLSWLSDNDNAINMAVPNQLYRSKDSTNEATGTVPSPILGGVWSTGQNPATYATRTANLTLGPPPASALVKNYPVEHFTIARPVEIDVQGRQDLPLLSPLLSIVNNDLTPNYADGTDFGSATFGATPPANSSIRTFRINNLGTGGLMLTNITPLATSRIEIITDLNPADVANFSVTAQPASLVGALNFQDFTITFAPVAGASGLKTALVRIYNNDFDENPYIFKIQGVACPGILTMQISGTLVVKNNESANLLGTVFSGQAPYVYEWRMPLISPTPFATFTTGPITDDNSRRHRVVTPLITFRQPVTLTVTDRGGLGCSTVISVEIAVQEVVGNPIAALTRCISTIADKRVSDAAFQVPNEYAAKNLPYTAEVYVPLNTPASTGQTIRIDYRNGLPFVVILGAGPASVLVRTIGNASNPAASCFINFNITKGVQTVTFPTIGDRAWNSGTVSLSGTSSADLPVTFRVISGPATISGSTLTMTGTTGVITVAATQVGNANYEPAEVIQTFNIIKANQTVNTPIGASSRAGTNYSLASIISSAGSPLAATGLPLVFTIVSGPGTITGTNVVPTGAGTIIVRVTQVGNDLYNAFTQDFSIAIGKGFQILTVTPITNKEFNSAPFSLGASTTSGLPLTYTISRGTGRIEANGTFTVVGSGYIEILVFQAGNADYEPVGPETIRFFVNPQPPVITITRVSATEICGSENIDVDFTTIGEFTSGNSFRLFLSDAQGAFTPTNPGITVTATPVNNATYRVTIPNRLPAGTNYRLRIQSTFPEVTSANTSAALTITARPNIPAIAVSTTPQGATVLVCTEDGTSFQWFLAGQPIAGATSKTFTATASGLYRVQVSNGRCAAQSADVQYTAPAPVGINDEAFENSLRVYPNPSKGKFAIEADGLGKGKVSLSITDAIGREVYRTEVQGVDRGFRHEFDLTSSAPGAYLLQIRTQDGVKVIKLLKE